MFWRREKNESANCEGLVWFADKLGNAQMDPDFYQFWLQTMEDAFDVMGMKDRFRADIAGENGTSSEAICGINGLAMVMGRKNRLMLQNTMDNIKGVTTALQTFSSKGVKTVHYDGSKQRALDEWQAVVKLLAQTTIVAIVTPGLKYYVQGTQEGYERGTRNLFKHSNTVEIMGKPNEPMWRANVSGYNIIIIGDWNEIKSVHQSTGLSIFQMLQIRINEGLREAVKQGL